MFSFCSVLWAIGLSYVIINENINENCAMSSHHTAMAVLPISSWFRDKNQCYTLMISVDYEQISKISSDEDKIIMTTDEIDKMLIHSFDLQSIATAMYSRYPDVNSPRVLPHLRKNLQMLIFRFTKLENFEIPLDEFESLYMISFLNNFEMMKIPPSLQFMPATMFMLVIIESPVSILPNWIRASWTQVKELRLAGGELRDVSVLSSLSQLELLDIGENKLQEVPIEFSDAFPNMRNLMLRGNQLAPFSSSELLDAVPYIDLDWNLIASFSDLPWSVEEIESRLSAGLEVSLTGNPICEKEPMLTSLSICDATECSPLCNQFRINDQLCQPICNVSSCAFDNGRCTDKFELL